MDGKAIKKHRNDVFRLSELLASGLRVDAADTVKRDLTDFLTAMVSEDGLILKDLGVTGDLDRVLKALRAIYRQEV